MSYIAERIRDEEWYGIPCRVNYLAGYSKEKVVEWFRVLDKEGYCLMWTTRHQIIYRNKMNRHYMCIIETAFDVKKSFIIKHYDNYGILPKPQEEILDVDDIAYIRLPDKK